MLQKFTIPINMANFEEVISLSIHLLLFQKSVSYTCSPKPFFLVFSTLFGFWIHWIHKYSRTRETFLLFFRLGNTKSNSKLKSNITAQNHQKLSLTDDDLRLTVYCEKKANKFYFFKMLLFCYRSHINIDCKKYR